MDNELNVKIDNGIIQKANQDKNGNDLIETYLSKENALRLDSWTTNEIPLIIEGDDLNDHKFLKPGVYCCTNGQIAQQTENTPHKTSNFRLITIQNTGETDQSTFWGQQWIFGSHGGVYNRGIELPNYLPWRDIGSSAIVAQSLGTNGYVKYASGLIIQWGRTVFPANNPTTSSHIIILPIVFSAGSSDSDVKFNAYFTSSHTMVHVRYYGNYRLGIRCTVVPTSNVDVEWIAIGY